MGYFNSSYFRWLYTGITRASKNLYVLDAPNFTIDGNLIPPVVKHLDFKKDTIELSEEVLEQETQFDFTDKPVFLKHAYFAIIELLKEKNINIKEIRSSSYQEHYTFSRGDETVVLRFTYNSNDLITGFSKPAVSTDFADEVYSELTSLIQKKIIVREPKTLIIDIPEFSFDQPFLQEFYESLKARLEPENFRITHIEHKDYHEIYTIKKNGYSATYKFWYKKNGRFGKFEIIPTKTDGLTEEINELLSKKLV